MSPEMPHNTQQHKAGYERPEIITDRTDHRLHSSSLLLLSLLNTLPVYIFHHESGTLFTRHGSQERRGSLQRNERSLCGCHAHCNLSRINTLCSRKDGSVSHVLFYPILSHLIVQSHTDTLYRPSSIIQNQKHVESSVHKGLCL
jgi:hypothetical protein